MTEPLHSLPPDPALAALRKWAVLLDSAFQVPGTKMRVGLDPIVGLILAKMYELRVNQLLSFHPEIVELPYKVTEKVHQYVGWAVHQGYIMGVMETELARA